MNLGLENYQIITPDNNSFVYMGRISDDDKKSVKIIYAGTTISVSFTGKIIGILLHNYHYYGVTQIGYILDGKEGKIVVDKHYEDIKIPIAENLEDKEHCLTIFKRMDATHYFDFKGIYIDKNATVRKADELPKRKMECYGDSVSAGAVCEAEDYVAKCDPENHEGIYDNSWYSYSMMTARNLGAQINNIAQGGIAIFDKTGYYHAAPDTIGLETTYNKTLYFPEGPYSDWDFKKYTPNVVIFAVGQNDNHPVDLAISDPEYRRRWKDKYEEIIRDLRSKYPKATFVLITTVLMHHKEWDDAIDEIKNELNDERIHRYYFKRNGAATPGHPRISEQEEMATELTAFIKSLGEEIWED